MLLVAGIGAVLTVILEVWVVVQVVHHLGIVPTAALLLVVPMFGVRLVTRAGIDVFRRVQADLADQRVPGAALLDGLLVLLSGALLVVPGFVTDAIGLLLLVPPVRRVARGVTHALLFRRVKATKAIVYRDWP